MQITFEDFKRDCSAFERCKYLKVIEEHLESKFKMHWVYAATFKDLPKYHETVQLSSDANT